MSSNSMRVGFWWFLMLAGAAVTLLVVWATRVAHVSATTLLTVGVIVVAFSWLVALVTVPWNLYFAARRAAQEMTVARERGIEVRPASAYLAHVRERIGVFSRESAYPCEDVVTLRARADVADALLRETADGLQRAQATWADNLEHTRALLTTDISRLQETLDTDRAHANSRQDDHKRHIDQLARRIESTLDGFGDHQEVLTGLRALVRMIKTEPA